MIAMPLEELAAVMNGKLLSDGTSTVTPTGVATDTRRIKTGDLFFALDGANFKGTDFLSEAFRGGASAAVTHHPNPPTDGSGPLILVENAGQALMTLAGGLRERLTIPVIGITGSNGKTTTKDALQQVLRQTFVSVAAEGSFNNRVGLPLTLARAAQDTEVLILEMGTSEVGEIASLTAVAKPTIAIITSIGASHLQGLGSESGVLAEKITIVEGMKAEGLLLVNGDDDHLSSVIPQLRDVRGGPRVESYGLSESVDHRGIEANWNDTGVSFRLSEDGPILRSKLLGRHNLENLLAVAVVAKKLGMTEADLASVFPTIEPSAMRLEERNLNGQRVIVDCYNANPTSMGAAIEFLSTASSERRKVAVLGDMLELGEASQGHHVALGERCRKSQIQVFLFVGEAMRDAFDACRDDKSDCGWVESVQEARVWLSNHLAPADLVLVKGSRGIGLEKLFEESGSWKPS